MVFDCQRCGKCCEGAGGIVLTTRDVQRLAVHFLVEPLEVVKRFTVPDADKPTIASRDIGGGEHRCIFYDPALPGCTVHQARPDVCRAWPYFRGNLLDEASFAMAREDCPGIAEDARFEEFRGCGLAYRRDNELVCLDDDGPSALAPLPDETDD
jgi:hypothetical protein